jgi:hypothetical protein
MTEVHYRFGAATLAEAVALAARVSRCDPTLTVADLTVLAQRAYNDGMRHALDTLKAGSDG